MPIDTLKMLQIGPLKHSWMQHRQRKCLSIEKTGQSNKKSCSNTVFWNKGTKEGSIAASVAAASAAC